jgi:hypothetical protein
MAQVKERPEGRKCISIYNAQKRLEKAYALMDDVWGRLAPHHYEELQESLGAAKDFTTNAIGHCADIRERK